MATLLGPLLSIDAHGSVADTITTQKWRGIQTARHYSKPTGSPTTDQLTQRTRVTDAVHAWRNFLTESPIPKAYTTDSKLYRHNSSGYSLAIADLIRDMASPTTCNRVTRVRCGAFPTVQIAVKNMVTNVGVSDGYNVTLRYGISPSQLLITDTQPTSANRATFTLQATFPTQIFGQAFHGSQKLSGILPLTPSSLLPNIFPDPTMSNPGLWTLQPAWTIVTNRLVLNAPAPTFDTATIPVLLTTPGFFVIRTTGVKMTSSFKASHVINNSISPTIELDGVTTYAKYRAVNTPQVTGMRGDLVTVCAGYLTLIELFATS